MAIERFFSWIRKFDKETSNLTSEVHLSGLPANKFSYISKRLVNSLSSKEMNVNGTTVPQNEKEFSFKPASNEIIVVCYISLTIIHSGAFDSDVFGSLGSSLTNGLVLKHDTNETLGREITKLQDNRDVLDCFFGGQGIPGAPGVLGVFDSADWLTGRMEFIPHPIILDGFKGDRLYFEVRDNLTGLDSLTTAMLGYQIFKDF